MGEAVKTIQRANVFACAERGCDFVETRDQALATFHGQFFGHRIEIRQGDLVVDLLARLPVPEPEYVVHEMQDGESLMEAVIATADVDIVTGYDRWVKTPRGYVTVGFLRQMYAVVG